MDRMIRPQALEKDEPLTWSTGTGADVWEMFRGAIAGDVASLARLLDKDPSLVRGQYGYLRPLYFAVRENQVGAAALLLDRGANPMTFSGGHDSLLDIVRDRGYAEMQTLLGSTLERVHGVLPQAGAVASAIRERDQADVRSLLDASPALLHAGDERANQPIRWAVMTRQIDLIDELLARGANINARAPTGRVPFSSPTATTTIAVGSMRPKTPRLRRERYWRICGPAGRSAISARPPTSATWSGCGSWPTRTPDSPTARRTISRTTRVPARRCATPRPAGTWRS
jgi:hypothetical protein